MKIVLKNIVFVLLASLTTAAHSFQPNNLDNWDVEKIGQLMRYTPNDLERGEIYETTLFPNSRLSGATHEQWFKQFVAKDKASLGRVISTGEPKQSSEEILLITVTFKKSGVKQFAIYVSIKAGAGTVGVVRTSFSNPQSYLDYQPSLEAFFSIIKDEKVVQKEAVRPNFSRLEPIENMKAFGHVTTWGYNVFTKITELRLDNHVIFDDGSFSYDLNTITADGVSLSKRNNPNRWGKYKIEGGDFKVKLNTSESFGKKSGYEIYDSLPKGKRINGCWSITKLLGLGDGISSMPGTSINGWCFDKNGRFSKNHTFGFNGSTSNSPYGDAHNLPTLSFSSYSESDQIGWYQIEGQRIQLIYDDGTKNTFFIGLSDDILLLGEGHYFK